MSVVQEFNLNIIPDSGPVVVHVDQYDHGEGRLVAHLYNGSTPYSPVGASAMIQGTKPDGNFYMYSCDIDGNTVTANLEEIMTQVCGRVRTQFVITDSEDRTGTFVFELDVQSSALNGAGGSESIIEYIQEAIEETQEKALESEAWAVGQRGGTDVPATDPAYHNNSKYYSEQADTSATNAANSKSAASGSAEDSEAWAIGERGGVPVTSGDPTYHNNAEYWADVARQSAGASVVANTETETSSHAYAVGDQFIYNGVLYTATAPISIGGTITPGTNCTASDNIVDQLENKADLVGGKVPAAQLPSYVDDVIEGYYYNSKFYEEAAHTTEITPETGKIYVDLSTDVTYRWSGSAYIALSNPDIANDAVTAITTSTAEYPVPAVNELLKVIIGKINKFLDDLKTKKADKVSSATNGDFAGLDANGNLTDSGKKASDFLTSHQTIKQDGVTGATVNRFGTCSTAAGTSTKTVSITTGTFALVEGARVTVKFSNANTADMPMLNVNSTGAHYIYYRGVQVKSGGAPINVLSGTIDFVYDGSNYNIVGTFANAIPSTDTSAKIFLLGATSQSASNADSYSQDTAYVGTDGNLYSGSKVVATQNMIGDAWVTSHAYAVGDYCIDGNVLYKCKTAHTSSASYRPPYASYWDAVSVADELAVTNINNGSVEGISYVKHGKMRMLNVGPGGNRTITDLTDFISQNITTDDLPKNTTGSTFQIITASSGSWSMEIGQMNIYAKTSATASNKYALYKSGSLMPKTSTLLVGGQIVWYVE